MSIKQVTSSFELHWLLHNLALLIHIVAFSLLQPAPSILATLPHPIPALERDHLKAFGPIKAFECFCVVFHLLGLLVTTLEPSDHQHH